MKFYLVILLGTLAFVSSSVIPQEKQTKVVKNKVLLERQEKILELFTRINQDCRLSECVEICKTYNIEDNIHHYTKPDVVKEFSQHFKRNILGPKEIFSIFNEHHLRQAVSYFKLLHCAKDYETFFKTVVWGRQHLSKPMWVYCVSVAIVHRPDTKDMMLPPIYEILPHYFFPTEVIHEAQCIKQTYGGKKTETNDKDYQGRTIYANYSGHYLNLHQEQSLSYYLEDIGLNSMYYYYNVHYPTWMNTEEYGLKNKYRGAFHYFRLQQIVARYYLERLAHIWGEIPHLDIHELIETPYTPSLTYPNGLNFPNRPRFANLHEYFYNYGEKVDTRYGDYYDQLKTLERRIEDVAESGFAMNDRGTTTKLEKDTQEGLNILGNIIEGNGDIINKDLYGRYQLCLRHLLGYAPQPVNEHKATPAALEHYETCLRDPIYYQMATRALELYGRYIRNLPSYTTDDLTFDGIKVTGVELDKLITYMDDHYSDLTNAVLYSDDERTEDFHLRVHQQRLNHKPFNYKLHVKSNQDQTVVVKVFIGPKYDVYGRYENLTRNHVKFVELDHFVRDLKSGENTIERNSRDFGSYISDPTPGRELYRQVQSALEGNKEFHVDYKQIHFKWPQRMLLPRGSESGTTYRMFFFVDKYTPEKKETHTDDIPHFSHWDTRPFGYPLERTIKFDCIYEDLPNSLFKDVNIYHQMYTN